MTKSTLRQIASVLGESLRELRLCWRRVLVVSALVQLGALALLTPLLAWLFYRFLDATSGPVLVNFELAGLLNSPWAWLSLPLWAALLACLGYLSAGGLTHIFVGDRQGSSTSVPQALRSTLRDLRLVAGRSLLKGVLLLLVLAPVASVSLGVFTTLVLAPEESSPVLKLFPQTPAALVLLGLGSLTVAAIGLILLVRWGMTIPALVAERLPLSRAFGRSTQLMRGSGLTIAGTFLAKKAIAALVLGVVSALLGLANQVLLGAIADEVGTRWLVGASALLVFDSLVFAALGWLDQGWGASVAVTLYTRLSDVGSDRPPVSTPIAGGGRPSRRIVLACAALLALAVGLTVPSLIHEIEASQRPVLVTAHRGASGRAPENTLAALRAAIEDGADLAEIDVQEAADGVIVVAHDTTLARVAGRPEGIWELSAAELAAVDVGSWFGARFADETVPTLAQALELCDGRLMLNIELKIHGRERALVPSVVELIEEHGFAEQCILTSLEAPLLAEVRRLAPGLEIGQILSATLGKVHSLDVDFYSVQPMKATAAFVAESHAHGRKVHVWTLNTEGEISRWVDRGVDGIITDEPALAIGFLEARTPRDDLRAALSRIIGR